MRLSRSLPILTCTNPIHKPFCTYNFNNKGIIDRVLDMTREFQNGHLSNSTLKLR